mmetsp:Transcript_82184/g.129890  ORF Transcript_82184/g.129890 Transcript_82184/m.129890 type:complete len:261 (+) Transcript_82184:96-878(+)
MGEGTTLFNAEDPLGPVAGASNCGSGSLHACVQRFFGRNLCSCQSLGCWIVSKYQDTEVCNACTSGRCTPLLCSYDCIVRLVCHPIAAVSCSHTLRLDKWRGCNPAPSLGDLARSWKPLLRDGRHLQFCRCLDLAWARLPRREGVAGLWSGQTPFYKVSQTQGQTCAIGCRQQKGVGPLAAALGRSFADRMRFVLCIPVALQPLGRRPKSRRPWSERCAEQANLEAAKAWSAVAPGLPGGLAGRESCKHLHRNKNCHQDR